MIKENNMRDSLDKDMEVLEAKFNDFVESLQKFDTKAKKYIKKDGADSSDMWVYHLANILDEMDDMVTELATFGEDNDLF